MGAKAVDILMKNGHCQENKKSTGSDDGGNEDLGSGGRGILVG